MAGATVAAVALPLALAFGVASGATASAGLVTAILAGLVIGGLSGAPYQISGPTGAMSAVLIVVAHKYGLEGIFLAGAMSGVMLLLVGFFKLGRIVAFIPSPVMTGFTSGIALVIAIGQLDNLFGVSTPGAESAVQKLRHYLVDDWAVDPKSTLTGLIVIGAMLLWPTRLNLRFPGALLGLIVASLCVYILGWPVELVKEIPGTLLLEQRLHLSNISWSTVSGLIAPAASIAALGAIESLLCGAVAAKQTGIRLQANQELIAQGAGNLLIPLCGGVPATAAIARTSVGIKAGGRTRMTSIFHALILLASMFVLAPLMSRIPKAALAGILVVTAWRMNDWEEIRYIFRHRLKTASLTFLVTMVATVAFDLTQAIIVGTMLSAMAFISQIAQIDVEIKSVDHKKLLERGIIPPRQCPHVHVAFITGPLFFAATGHFNEAFAHMRHVHALILSMRGVPLVDTSGLLAIEGLLERVKGEGGTLMLVGAHEQVLEMLERGGLLEQIGRNNIMWSSDQAIVAAGEKRCPYCSSGAISAGEPPLRA